MKRTALRIFEGLYDSYDKVLDYGTLMQDRRWKSWAVGQLPTEAGALILDIGCGTCVLEEGMRGEGSVVGLDLTKQMLEIGRGKRLARISSLLHSDGERLPFREGSFDAVVSCYVVKYCNPSLLVSEVARVLKPGGVAVLYDFARPRGLFWPLNAIYVYGVLRLVGRFLERTDAGLAYTFTELPQIIAETPWDEGFERVLSGSGLHVREKMVLPGGVAVGFGATNQPFVHRQ